jgi:hypothetical protein
MQSQARKKVLTNKIYKAMKEKILNIGTYNNWRGCMGLYLTKKEIRGLKKLGITESTPIKEAYNLL